MHEEPGNSLKIKLIIAESQEIILQSLIALLKQFDGLEILGAAHSGHELLDILERLKPDVIILDLEKPGLSVIEVTRIIDQKTPWVKVISLSRHNHPLFIKEMLRHGAKGFLSKNCSPEELYDGIIRVCDGKTYFCQTCSGIMLKDFVSGQGEREKGLNDITPRENEIIRYLAEGFSTKEIASKLFISDKTIERHKSNLLKKMQLRNTAHLIKVAAENGLLN